MVLPWIEETGKDSTPGEGWRTMNVDQDKFNEVSEPVTLEEDDEFEEFETQGKDLRRVLCAREQSSERTARKTAKRLLRRNLAWSDPLLTPASVCGDAAHCAIRRKNALSAYRVGSGGGGPRRHRALGE